MITVIHQPRYEILAACNQVMLLAEGKLVYLGSPSIEMLAPVFPPLHRLLPDWNRTSSTTGALAQKSEEYQWQSDHGRDPSSIFTTPNQSPSSSSSSPVETPMISCNVADLLIDHIEEFNWRPSSSAGGHNIYQGSVNHLPVVQPRPTLGFIPQLIRLTRRALLQQIRDLRSLITLYGLTLCSSLLIGALYAHSKFVGPPMAEGQFLVERQSCRRMNGEERDKTTNSKERRAKIDESTLVLGSNGY